MINVDKHIPIPEMLLTSRSRVKFPFLTMEVGDSLFFTDPKEKDSARGAWHQCRKKHGLKWQFRTLYSTEEKGWRMWRID